MIICHSQMSVEVCQFTRTAITFVGRFFFFGMDFLSADARLVKRTFADREASVSRHNGVPITGPPYSPQYNSAIM